MTVFPQQYKQMHRLEWLSVGSLGLKKDDQPSHSNWIKIQQLIHFVLINSKRPCRKQTKASSLYMTISPLTIMTFG